MKKTTQASVFLSLLHIFLLCLSFQVHVTEARFPRGFMPTWPSRPCGATIGSQVMTTRNPACRRLPRPPHRAAVPRHPMPPRKN
ncbi:hypothetical protein AALP_AAs63758U000100 [Arabis alpina]|uniref:Uncharacterized protein n=1 Tax=Arabis alpina TaxID=50452 RepID=A0A087G391_ARAAL|nr:hypothetical protein AALP_AAs63758U000100 [Arabis alpina]